MDKLAIWVITPTMKKSLAQHIDFFDFFFMSKFTLVSLRKRLEMKHNESHRSISHYLTFVQPVVKK